MLVDTINVVRRPYKVRLEIRTYDRVKYTVTIASNASRPMNQIVRELREMGYREDSAYVDRYGYLRVVYKNLSWNDIMVMRSVAESVMDGIRREKRVERPVIYAV